MSVISIDHRPQSWISLLAWCAGSCLIVALSAFGLRLLEGAFATRATEAATLPYQGVVVSLSVPSTLNLGQSASVSVTIKNIGSATWSKTGKNFLSLYHWDPSRRIETTSLFSTPGWNSDKRPVLLLPATLRPGETTTFTFPIKAPSTQGNFHEEYILAAENVAWIKNSNFALDIKVGGGNQVAVSPSPVTVPVAPALSTIPPSTEWSAQLVEKGGQEWQIDVGEHVTAHFVFKNTGTKTWLRDSKDYVSIYAVEGTKERKSLFKDFLWLGETHAIKMKEGQVKPGEIAHFELELRAPPAPGSYQEMFALAAENTAWISGSQVTLPIKVPLTGEFVATAPPGDDVFTSVTDAQAQPKGDYAAFLLLRSTQALTLLGNGRQELTFGFKNVGKVIWNSRAMRIKSITPVLADNLSSIRDDSWIDASFPTKITGSTNQGEIGFLTFKIKAPVKKGNYTASFELVADNQLVEGGQIDIPITVTADGYIEPRLPVSPSRPATPTNSNQPSLTNLVPLNGDLSTLSPEPMIRVGLYKTTDNQMVVRAKYAPFSVFEKNGTKICSVANGNSTTVVFDRVNRVYKVSGGGCVGTSADVFLVRTDDGISPMEITDFTRNDNTFRRQLELRYTPATDSVWVINELSIEWYLKGIAETSNISPQEFQRTLLTAARTYAMYHVQRGTKHANENYIVDATYDQVYRGYGSEARTPNISAAVDATRGQIVTNDGKLAITPYFSRSDGRTRSWSEVWYGSYSWMVSVPVPWDQGKTLWGHGVGMSATGALGAANDGWTYDRILKYFYTGIELRLAYK